eukprot:TRINITY_DN3654_c0_g1_i2.p1 TRINITY_DN3654_c0_g1~~TRINITY_DN3654_c0_g1_i2.p1  ORF type:complete len:267 (-),score=48.85 TRINITY_DN3654_c0_g1_i2:172-972(-)
MEKSRLNEEALADKGELGKLFEEVGRETKVLTQEETLAKVSASIVRNIPPHDASAETPEKVYLLENIIGEEEWNEQPNVRELIEAGTNTILATEFQETSDYPFFVRNRIQNLKHLDEVKQDRLAHIFSYITHLVNFNTMPVNLIRRLLKARDGGRDEHMTNTADSSKIPAITLNKFLKLFTESSRQLRPKGKVDLLVSYVLVLTLIADGFETNPSDIAKDLRMGNNEVRTHYFQLGCKSRGTSSNCKIYLPVPLTLPAPKDPRKRR